MNWPIIFGVFAILLGFVLALVIQEKLKTPIDWHLIPHSLRPFEGAVGLRMFSILPCMLVEVQEQHPDGWRVTDLIQTARDFGIDPEEDIFTSKSTQVLEMLKEIGYIQIVGDKYTTDSRKIKGEIELTLAEHRQKLDPPCNDILLNPHYCLRRLNESTTKRGPGLLPAIKSFLFD